MHFQVGPLLVQGGPLQVQQRVSSTGKGIECIVEILNDTIFLNLVDPGGHSQLKYFQFKLLLYFTSQFKNLNTSIILEKIHCITFNALE